MKILYFAIIGSVTISIIVSLTFFTIPDNRLHCTFCPEDRTPNQTLTINDITTAPTELYVGSTFLIYADVNNPNPYSVYVNNECISPISATFNQGVTVVNSALVSCIRITKQEIQPGQDARIVGPSIGITYTASSVGKTNATITISYEAQEHQYNVTTNRQIIISYPASTPSQIVDQLRLAQTYAKQSNATEGLRLDCKIPMGIQMRAINESVNQTKAIALAYTSQEFLNESQQYGNLYYNSFFNDWITDDPCNTIWKDVELVFTGYDKNGNSRNIQVTEDIDLTKVLNVTNYGGWSSK
ncbi:MAG: hypothetical protein KGI10_01115 [Thaumarchaeota archaeon]|nr:hypothetical protein [Nitrososphaerota archaeon]